MGIKVWGNKIMLRLTLGMGPWLTDWLLFVYEVMTATLLRILLLSIPDLNTAQLMSLLDGLVEVCVRIFFFSNFTQMPMHTSLKEMNREQRVKYALWGRMRVAGEAKI